MSHITDALMAMQARYPDLSLTPLRMSDALVCSVHRRPGSGARRRLHPVEVVAIRARYIPRRCSIRQLGREYGVSHAVIHDIVHGRTYKEVA